VNPNADPPIARWSRPDLFRVVVTGSECTGKTTLAQSLAEHYSADLVPEFIRGFAESMGGRIQFADHGPIARGQMALEDEHAASAAGLLIHDTDLLSTVLYCRHYFDRCPEWIVAAAMDRRPNLYLVCDIDVPWMPDTLRERGDRREEMHLLFTAAVEESGAKWALMGGGRATRFEKAQDLIDFMRQ
jgi:NadR type nicotinamide-nucleotide adenylyltransferase